MASRVRPIAGTRAGTHAHNVAWPIPPNPDRPDREPLPVRQVTPASIARWLCGGLADLRATPVASLAQGLVVAVGGWIVVLARPALLVARSRRGLGLRLVAPILCTGLYELSRLTARGERPGLAERGRCVAARVAPAAAHGAAAARAGDRVGGRVRVALPACSSRRRCARRSNSSTTPRWSRATCSSPCGSWSGALGGGLVFALCAVAPPLHARSQGRAAPRAAHQRARGGRQPDHDVPVGAW